MVFFGRDERCFPHLLTLYVMQVASMFLFHRLLRHGELTLSYQLSNCLSIGTSIWLIFTDRCYWLCFYTIYRLSVNADKKASIMEHRFCLVLDINSKAPACFGTYRAWRKSQVLWGHEILNISIYLFYERHKNVDDIMYHFCLQKYTYN